MVKKTRKKTKKEKMEMPRISAKDFVFSVLLMFCNTTYSMPVASVVAL